MLDYEWPNSSTIILSPDDHDTHQPDPTRPDSFFDPIHPSLADHRHLLSPPPPLLTTFSNHQFLYPTTTTTTTTTSVQFQHSFYGVDSSYAYPGTGFFPVVDHQPGTAPYMVVPKTEEVCRASSRIGLNLGGRTYFSAADEDFVSRLYRRESCMSNTPRCQAEGCNADLSQAKHYHRRHKVCDFHSKASTVLTAGLTQRFCQQCSRFHLLSEFDNGKRSCRKRLADHNRRRRKSHQSSESPKPMASPESGTPRSSNESGTQSSSCGTVPMSPPSMSLECFRQRQFHQASASSSSSNSIFFSSG